MKKNRFDFNMEANEKHYRELTTEKRGLKLLNAKKWKL